MSETFTISVPSDEAGDEVRSLTHWLSQDEDLASAKIRSGEPDVKPGEMGPVTDVIEVLLQPDGIATAVITGVITWLTTRKKSVKVKITKGDRTVEIEAPKVSEIDKIAKAVSDQLDDKTGE